MSVPTPRHVHPQLFLGLRRQATLAPCRVGAAVAALNAACAGSPAAATRSASQTELAQSRARRGALVSAETTFTGMRGRYATYRIRLTGGAGRTATGRLISPRRGVGARTGARRFPAVLLNDGREFDSRAVDYLPPEFGDIVVLSLDYPAALPHTIQLSDVLLHGDRLRKAAEQAPALFSLGGAYLAGRDDVDSTRLAIVATSFAVPFAVVAAAAEERFRNVARIYGAGDLHRVLAANLTLRPRVLRSAAAWPAMRPFRALEPERYVARIAPRPLVMVNGIDDPQIPRAAVEALYAAAREPQSLIWLRTGHLMPTDSALIRALVDTALARLPVLHGVGRAGRAADSITMPAVPSATSAQPANAATPTAASIRAAAIRRLAARLAHFLNPAPAMRTDAGEATPAVHDRARETPRAHDRPGQNHMRADITEGASFPDYEFPDHTDTPRTLSLLQGDDPMVLTLHRGNFCPKDRQQLHQLVPFAAQCAVGYTRLVSITTDDSLLALSELRLGVGASWPFLYDKDRRIARELEIEEYTDERHHPMIPHTFVLEPGLRIYRIYNGYWYWGRPSTAELHQDLREVTSRCRADWHIDTPEMRAKWASGERDVFYPYGTSMRQALIRAAGAVDRFVE